MNYSAFNMQCAGMLLPLNWSRLQCHIVYNFIIQICYRTHWQKAICILHIFRSFTQSVITRILCFSVSKAFPQPIQQVQPSLARICMVLCTCIAVHVITTPEVLFMLCAQDACLSMLYFRIFILWDSKTQVASLSKNKAINKTVFSCSPFLSLEVIWVCSNLQALKTIIKNINHKM